MQRQQVYRYAPAPAIPRRSVPPTYRPRRAARISYQWFWISAALVAVMSLGFGAALTLFYVYFNLANRIAPGVRSGDVSLGGLTTERAAQRLSEAWQAGALVMSDGQRKWPAPAGELGFSLDAAATAERAYAAGRSPSGWINPARLLLSSTRQVEPAAAFNPAAARSKLETAATQINIPAQEARVTYTGGHWQAIPGKTGLQLNIDATVQLWQMGAEAYLKAGLLPLKLHTVAPAVMDASGQAAALEKMMDAPLKLRAYDPITDETFDLSFPPDQVAGWVRVSQTADVQPQIQLDGSALEQATRQLSGQLGDGRYLDQIEGLDNLTERWQKGRPLTALVRHDPTSYTVQAGENMVSIAFETGMPFWMIQQANPDVNPNSLAAGQTLTIPSVDENLPLPVVQNKRIVISISQQRMWTYEDGQQRTENVISTGIARSPTMPGAFQVRSHEPNAYASIWNLWMPNFLGIYEATPGFMNGIHGLPMLSSGVRLWGNVLGQPASYGCIIMTLDEAEELYNWAEEGVVVEIQP